MPGGDENARLNRPLQEMWRASWHIIVVVMGRWSGGELPRRHAACVVASSSGSAMEASACSYKGCARRARPSRSSAWASKSDGNSDISNNGGRRRVLGASRRIGAPCRIINGGLAEAVPARPSSARGRSMAPRRLAGMSLEGVVALKTTSSAGVGAPSANMACWRESIDWRRVSCARHLVVAGGIGAGRRMTPKIASSSRSSLLAKPAYAHQASRANMSYGRHPAVSSINNGKRPSAVRALCCEQNHQKGRVNNCLRRIWLRRDRA